MELRLEIKTIAVIGAGTMGRGIAYAAAFAEYRVVLADVNEGVLEQARKSIQESFEEGVRRGKLAYGERDAAVARVSFSASIEEAVRDAELIIEAIPEDLQLKREVFARLASRAKDGAIFASNTSALAIHEFTEAVKAPERCIGMHFFNPVPKMRLVEIVRTTRTSDETVARCVGVAQRMQKETVVIREAPGFITSRVNALIGNEAFAILEAGIATASDIDKAVKLGLNHPMGPFELVDLVGLDVRLKVLEHLHETLGEKYRPSELLKQYVAEGRLGRKTGRGVYEYPKA